MITPASIGDWTQAVAMTSLLAGAGLALSRALRDDVGLATEPPPRQLGASDVTKAPRVRYPSRRR